MSIKSMYNKIIAFFVLWIGKIHWKNKNELTQQQLAVIREMLINDYYIILTRRKNHLSTYAINFADWVKTGKFGFYSHVLMNTEDEVKSNIDFRLIEAIGVGTCYSPFEKVFDVNSVAFLKPKGVTIEDWTIILDNIKNYLGLPYDTLFDILDKNSMSCVELIRAALMSLPDYEKRFSNFEEMITTYKVLTPSMFYNCPDFEIVFEIR